MDNLKILLSYGDGEIDRWIDEWMMDRWVEDGWIDSLRQSVYL